VVVGSGRVVGEAAFVVGDGRGTVDGMERWGVNQRVAGATPGGGGKANAFPGGMTCRRCALLGSIRAFAADCWHRSPLSARGFSALRPNPAQGSLSAKK
jgi:hypothetical protein